MLGHVFQLWRMISQREYNTIYQQKDFTILFQNWFCRGSLLHWSVPEPVWGSNDPLNQCFWCSNTGENDANLLPTAETRKKCGRNVSVLLLPGHFCPVLLAQPAVCLCDGFCLVCSGGPCLISIKMNTSVPSMQNAALPPGIAWEGQGCTL